MASTQVVTWGKVNLRHLQRLQGTKNSRPFRQLPIRWQRAMLNLVLRVALGRLLTFAGDDKRGTRARQEFSKRIVGQMSRCTMPLRATRVPGVGPMSFRW